MVKNVMQFLLTAILFITIDSLYLKLTTSHFKSVVSRIQGSPLEMNIYATFMSYITLVVGLYYFIIQNKKPVSDAALLGWIIYLVFDFTNKAIFKDWSWFTVLLDGTWGGFVFGATTYLVYKIFGIKS